MMEVEPPSTVQCRADGTNLTNQAQPRPEPGNTESLDVVVLQPDLSTVQLIQTLYHLKTRLCVRQ